MANFSQLHLLSLKMLFSHFIGGGGGVNGELFPTLSPKSQNAIFPFLLGGGG